MPKIGFLETYNNQMVSGWIPTDIKGEVVSIAYSSECEQRTIAEIFKQQVAAEVVRTDTGVSSYGFYVEFPHELLNVDNLIVRVFYGEEELENSPQKILRVGESNANLDFASFEAEVLAGMPSDFEFSFPDMRCLGRVDERNVAEFGEGRIRLLSEMFDNVFYLPESQKCTYPIQVTFHGEAKNNLLIIGSGAEIYGTIDFHGCNNVIVIGEDIADWSMLKIRMWSNNQLLVWGKGSTSNGVEVVMQGDQGKVLVADDCMFANDIYLRNSDMHPMINLKTKEWVNKPANVVIHRHVWVAQESLILKGTTIGTGSIVGAKSLVNKTVPQYSLIGGVPAAVLRKDVSWDRTEFPRESVIDALSADCFFQAA